MSRPTILIATTDPVMACALHSRLGKACLRLGLKLELCPGGDGEQCDFGNEKLRVYSCAEALFDHLESCKPMDLADTLVVLDVGTRLKEAFEPAASKDNDWHITGNRRAGVAVELILRFPQIFPVILSPAVPCDEPDKIEVFEPTTRDIGKDEWQQFRSVWHELCVKHRLKEEDGEAKEVCQPLCISDALLAYRVPLHFMSPLDGGRGLVSTLVRFAHGMRCVFDSTGLRTLVRNYFLGTVFGNKENWKKTEKQREELAGRLNHMVVTIDEEPEFSFFNAYSAYKFGYRAWMVTTYAEFGGSSESDSLPLWAWQGEGKDINKVVILRDVDLRFPDLPDDADPIREHLKSVCSPVWAFQKNKQKRMAEEWRCRVVSSNEHVIEEIDCPSEWTNEGQCQRGEKCQYIGHKEKEFDYEYLGLRKPVGTLYRIKSLLNTIEGSMLSRISTVSERATGGHGAPYSNLAMAESLLRQSKGCSGSPVASLVGAFLASEAYCLLLGMSRTTALEALQQAHKQEAEAEISFVGVAHEMRIHDRKDDIEASLDKLYEEPDTEKGKTPPNVQISDHRIRISNIKRIFLSQFWAEMRVIYREGEHFSAAEAANIESLVRLEWRLFPSRFTWTRKLKKLLRMPWMGMGFKRLLLKPAVSIGAWVLAFLLNVLFFTTSYALVWGRSFQCSWEGVFTYGRIFAQVLIGSFGMQLLGNGELVHPKQYDGWQLFAMLFHVGFSYVLFGLLISMIYRKITRS